MPSEPVDVPRVLLDLAAEDELMARSLLPVQGVTDTGIGFHTQQAVEKALKAVLAANGIEFPYSHDLDGLTRLCEKNGIDIPPELADVDELSPFAARTRYGASPAAHLDRDQALTWAATAVTWARDIVEQPPTKKVKAHGDYHFEPTTVPGPVGTGPILPEWLRKPFRRIRTKHN